MTEQQDQTFDLLRIWGLNGFTLGVVTFADLEAVLKILLLVASLTYTVLKIIDRNKKK